MSTDRNLEDDVTVLLLSLTQLLEGGLNFGVDDDTRGGLKNCVF